MVSSKFAFRAFLLLAIVSCTIVAVFLAHIGVFGTAAQEFLARIWAPIQKFYQAHQEPSDNALKALGIVGSAASATFAIVKAWHYAEINLPSRVEDFIRDETAQFYTLRPQMVQVLRTSSEPEHFTQPSTQTVVYNRVLEIAGLGTGTTRAQTLVNAAKSVDDALSVVEAKRDQLRAEKATVHLLRGLHLANVAASAAEGSALQRETNERALAEFEEALRYQGEDLEVLEAAAAQSIALGKEPQAFTYLERLRKSAEHKAAPCAQARALRLKASVLATKSKLRHWDDARSALDAAINLLEGDRGAGQIFDPDVELAEAYLLMGIVQTRRERFLAASRALNAATEAVEKIPTHLRSSINQRIDAAKRDYNDASMDPGTEDA